MGDENAVDIVEVLGGVMLLILGVLAVVPLPVDGWLVWVPPDPSMTTLVVGMAVVFILLGGYLIVAGVRSDKHSQRGEVVGYVCLICSCVILFAGLATENETWTTVSLLLGTGLLIIGIVVVGRRISIGRAGKRSTGKADVNC